jgi:hypothetical protein
MPNGPACLDRFLSGDSFNPAADFYSQDGKKSDQNKVRKNGRIRFIALDRILNVQIFVPFPG